MSDDKEWTRAEDLMAELESDPDFQAAQAERDKRRAHRRERLDDALRPILEDLSAVGFQVRSLQELVEVFSPIPPDAVNVLLNWLPRVEHERVQESIIRSLAAAGEPFDGRVLVALFERSDSLRWAIANTMAEARPFGISDCWLVEAVQSAQAGTAKEMLVLALARLVPDSVSLPILRSLFNELPGHVPQALAEVGGMAELDFLNSKQEGLQSWQHKEVRNAIRKIEKRLSAH